MQPDPQQAICMQTIEKLQSYIWWNIVVSEGS
jgi:hypothetical protein